MSVGGSYSVTVTPQSPCWVGASLDVQHQLYIFCIHVIIFSTWAGWLKYTVCISLRILTLYHSLLKWFPSALVSAVAQSNLSRFDVSVTRLMSLWARIKKKKIAGWCRLWMDLSVETTSLVKQVFIIAHWHWHTACWWTLCAYHKLLNGEWEKNGNEYSLAQSLNTQSRIRHKKRHRIGREWKVLSASGWLLL